MDESPQNPVPRGDATREALIRAAIEIFARDGFHAAGTRTLAESAGVNQALIGYHFGGKQGLYFAVFEHIAARLRERIGPLAGQIEISLAEAPPELDSAARRARFLPPLLALCDGTVSLLLSAETEHWAQLIIREQQAPTAAFERLYGDVLGGLLGLLTRLVMGLRGEADGTAARVTVVGLLGQIIVWRASRAGVMRHMGWTRIAAAEIEIARDAVRRHVTQMLAQSEGMGS
jgi:AcrR family transcriptional regulator